MNILPEAWTRAARARSPVTITRNGIVLAMAAMVALGFAVGAFVTRLRNNATRGEIAYAEAQCAQAAAEGARLDAEYEAALARESGGMGNPGEARR
jgi:hypothetical protein